MHGIYFYLEPLFLLFLILITATALYVGLFKAHGPTASFVKKAFSGIASFTISGLAWFLMYSHQYLGW